MGRSEEIAKTAGAENSLESRITRRDPAALAELFSQYRPRLWRIVNFRMHPRLRGRIDADDILQEAWLRAADRVEHMFQNAAQSRFIWFRLIVAQTLADVHRRHLGAEMRDATRDVSIHESWGGGDSTSSCLASQLAGNLTSPSSALQHVDVAKLLDVALQGMNDVDREVLAMRHFEELSNAETAQLLNMSEQAASGRYLRALRRLKKILETVPGFQDQKP